MLPIIFFERNVDIDPDEPEFMAQGGRTGLSYLLAEDTNERIPFKMGRRAFLKINGWSRRWYWCT